jgi:hypothetical protein
MSNSQLLGVLFIDEGTSISPTHTEASMQDDDDREHPSCEDEWACHDFAALTEGNFSITGVYRLSRHMQTCDSCKYLFASMMDDLRRANALDNFDDNDE